MGYIVNPSLEIVDAEGGAIALDKKTGAYLQLNAMGLRVLRALLDGRSTSDIQDELVAEYPDQAHRIGSDLEAMEHDLLARAVVTVVGP